jgi:hypothetical protein
MKSKLLLYYEVVFNSLYYKYYKEDEEKSKRLAFGVVRNGMGVMIFLIFVVCFVVFACVFKLNTSFLNRPLLYLIFGVCGYYYYLITEKFLKPLFDNAGLKKEKPSNYYYEISVVLFSLFGGGMYVLGRLLTFYLCG